MIERIELTNESEMIKLCLAFLQCKELINPELAIVSRKYKGQDTQLGYISSSGAVESCYTQDNIPTVEELNAMIKKHGNVMCIASIDEEDEERITLAVLLDTIFQSVFVNCFESRVEDKKRILRKLIAKATAEN